jgi:hypothetical protein
MNPSLYVFIEMTLMYVLYALMDPYKEDVSEKCFDRLFGKASKTHKD